MEDAQGVLRGGCRECGCRRYVLPSVSRCEYCNHLPIHHEELFVPPVPAAPPPSSSSSSLSSSLSSSGQVIDDDLMVHTEHPGGPDGRYIATHGTAAPTTYRARTSPMPPQLQLQQQQQQGRRVARNMPAYQPHHDQPHSHKNQHSWMNQQTLRKSQQRGTESGPSPTLPPPSASASAATAQQTNEVLPTASLLAYVESLKKNGVMLTPPVAATTTPTAAATAASAAAPTQSAIDELLALLRANLSLSVQSPAENTVTAVKTTSEQASRLQAPLTNEDAGDNSTTSLCPPQPTVPVVSSSPAPVPTTTSSANKQVPFAPRASAPAHSTLQYPAASSTDRSSQHRSASISTSEVPPPKVNGPLLAPASSGILPTPSLTTPAAGTYSVKKVTVLTPVDRTKAATRGRKRGSRATRSRSKLETVDIDGIGNKIDPIDEMQGEEGNLQEEENNDELEDFEKRSIVQPRSEERGLTPMLVDSSPQDNADIGRRRRKQDRPEELIPIAFLENSLFTPPQTPLSTADVSSSVPETKRVHGKGTGNPKYSITLVQCTNKTLIFNAISAMSEYRNKSFEELRWEDWELGNRGNQVQPSLFSQIDTSTVPYPLPSLPPLPPVPSLLPTPLPFDISSTPPLETLALPSLPLSSMTSPYRPAKAIAAPIESSKEAKGKEKVDQDNQPEEEEQIIYESLQQPKQTSADVVSLDSLSLPTTSGLPNITVQSASHLQEEITKLDVETAKRLYGELRDIVEYLGQEIQRETTTPSTSDSSTSSSSASKVDALTQKVNLALYRLYSTILPFVHAKEVRLASSSTTNPAPSPDSRPPRGGLPMPVLPVGTPLSLPSLSPSYTPLIGNDNSTQDSPLRPHAPAPSSPFYPVFPAPASSPFSLRTYPLPIESPSVFKRFYIKGSYVPFLEDFAHEFKDVARNKKEHYYAISNHPKLETNLIAFLNSKDGGTLYFGIHDSGQVVGVSITRDQLDTLKNVIWAKMETFNPVPDPHLYRIEMVPVCNAKGTAIIKDLYVVEIHITGGTKLYFNSQDRAWIRRDAGNHCLKSGTEIRDFIEQRRRERHQEKRGEKRSHGDHTPVSSTPKTTLSASVPQTSRRSRTCSVKLFPFVRPVHKDGSVAPIWRPRDISVEPISKGNFTASTTTEALETEEIVDTPKRPKPSHEGESKSLLVQAPSSSKHDDVPLVETSQKLEETSLTDVTSRTPAEDSLIKIEKLLESTAEEAPLELNEKIKDLDEQMQQLSANTSELISLTEIQESEPSQESELIRITTDVRTLDQPERSSSPNREASAALESTDLISSKEKDEAATSQKGDEAPKITEECTQESLSYQAYEADPKESAATLTDAPVAENSVPSETAMPVDSMKKPKEAEDEEEEGEEMILLPARSVSVASSHRRGAALPPFSFVDFSNSFFSFSPLSESSPGLDQSPLSFPHFFSSSPEPTALPTSFASSSSTASSSRSADSSSQLLPSIHPTFSNGHAHTPSTETRTSLSLPSTPISSTAPAPLSSNLSASAAAFLTPPRSATEKETKPSSEPTSKGKSVESANGERKVGKNRRKKERIRKGATSAHSTSHQQTSTTSFHTAHDSLTSDHGNTTSTGGQTVDEEASFVNELEQLERVLEEDRKQLIAQYASFFSDLVTGSSELNDADAKE